MQWGKPLCIWMEMANIMLFKCCTNEKNVRKMSGFLTATLIQYIHTDKYSVPGTFLDDGWVCFYSLSFMITALTLKITSALLSMSDVSVGSKLLPDNISLLIQLHFAIWVVTSVMLGKHICISKITCCAVASPRWQKHLQHQLSFWIQNANEALNVGISCHSQNGANTAINKTYCNVFSVTPASESDSSWSDMCSPGFSSESPSVQTDESKPKTPNNVSVQSKTSSIKAAQDYSSATKGTQKAIPLIILSMKVTNGPETWQPLGSLRKHQGYWREVSVSNDRSPYEELPAT